jgi:signal transduction histidine kinase
MRIVRSRAALLGFAMVFATLAVNALISYLNVRRLHENRLAVERTHNTRLALSTLSRHLADAETGQRGFLITGQPGYLEPYQDGVAQVDAVLSELGILLVTDLAQRENHAQLESQVGRLLNLIHENVLTRQKEGWEASRAEVLAGQGKQAMEQVRATIDRMEQIELRKLAVRNRDSQISYQTAVVTGFIAAALGVGLGAVGYWLVLRELQTRERSAADLSRLNEGLEARVRERTAAISDANAALRAEIEDRQRAEEQARHFAAELQNSNRALEQFASVASHDLQEPLRKIQAFGDRLATGYRDQLGERGQDYIDRMRAAAARMRKLIDDLLSYSRVATRGQPFQTVNLQQVAREVLDDLDERVRQTGGQVDVGELPTLSADPLQMRQLLQNLVANGLKFHRPDTPPRVCLSARLEQQGGENPSVGDRWVISVCDNGVGFEPVYAERIFDLFQRLHGRDQYEGTGMGLAICKKIAERHGGSIAAHGAPGQGARFDVTLPADQSRTGGEP